MVTCFLPPVNLCTIVIQQTGHQEFITATSAHSVTSVRGFVKLVPRYEAPENPEITLDTVTQTPQDNARLMATPVSHAS